MRKFFSAGLLIAVMSLFANCGAFAQSEQSFLIDQLSLLSRFSEVQAPSGDISDNNNAAVIKGFILAAEAETANDEVCSDQLASFCKLVFSGESNSSNSSLLRVLGLAGRLQYAKCEAKLSAYEKPFSNHVKEAISLNKSRAEFYSKVSKGQTKGLSRHYTTLEYCLLPLATIFDHWAQRLNRRGIPAMQNDFVPMTGAHPIDTQLQRTGTLNRAAAKVFGNLLYAFQQKVYAAASHKDFLQIRLAASEILHSLKQLERQHNCNLSLSIHFIESIGLAAVNADILSSKYEKQSDNFYQAFLILQAAGLRLFSLIDLKAQLFHQQGIGIITNDLPAIPFP